MPLIVDYLFNKRNFILPAGLQMRYVWRMFQIATVFEPSHQPTFCREKVEMQRL